MRFPTPPSTGSPLAPQPEVNKSLRPRGRAKSAPVKFILVHKETTQLQAGFYQPLGSSPTLRLNLNTSAESLLPLWGADRKSTRLNSSHSQISYAVFCLKKKKKK